MLARSLRREVPDFPGATVVGTSPSNAGGVGLILGQEAKITSASMPKNQNRSNIVTNFI